MLLRRAGWALALLMSLVLAACNSAPPPPSPERSALPGLTGSVAYLDNDCRFHTVDLALLAGQPEGLLRARSGQEAWIEATPGGAALHVRDQPGGAVRSVAVGRSFDELVGLSAYVVDDTLLLAGSGYASSGLMTDGSFFMLLDPQTGARRELPFRAHGMAETLAIAPGTRERLAVVASAVGPPLAPDSCVLLIVALRDRATSCVTPEYARTPVWSADGARLAYATRSGAIALVVAAELQRPPVLLPTQGTTTGLIRWLDERRLLYVTYAGPPNDAQERAANRDGLLKGDRTSGHDPETGEALPRFHPRTQPWVTHVAWAAAGTHIPSA